MDLYGLDVRRWLGGLLCQYGSTVDMNRSQYLTVFVVLVAACRISGPPFSDPCSIT